MWSVWTRICKRFSRNKRNNLISTNSQGGEMFIRWKREILLLNFINYINLLLEKDQINTYKELGKHSVDELSAALTDHSVEEISVQKLRIFILLRWFLKTKSTLSKRVKWEVQYPLFRLGNVNILLLTKHNLFGTKNWRFLHINMVRHMTCK